MSTCPYCGKFNPVASHALGDDDLVPEPGDWSLCVGCGKFSVFVLEDRVRKPTRAEMRELAEDPEAEAAAMAWRISRM